MTRRVAPMRFQHADLARPLRHRNQHDVGQAHAADGQRQRPYEAQQHAQRDAHGIHQPHVFVEDERCARRVRRSGEKLCMRASVSCTWRTALSRNTGLAGIHTISSGYFRSRYSDAVSIGNEDAFVVGGVVVGDLGLGLAARRPR